MSDAGYVTVWTVFNGTKYPREYVYWMQAQVARWLSLPHRFRCITCAKLVGIDCVQPSVDFTGWWAKIGLWDKPGGIYLDLDTVIVGPIDYLEEYTRFPIAAPENWAQSGHGGIQSSVLAWDGSWREPIERFNEARDTAEGTWSQGGREVPLTLKKLF